MFCFIRSVCVRRRSINNQAHLCCEQLTENLLNIRAEDTEQIKLYEQLYMFISFLGFISGYRFKYDWKPTRSGFYCLHAFALAAVWLTIGYAVHNTCTILMTHMCTF